MESRPDVWFRGGYQEYLQRVRSKLAMLLGAQPAELVLVENASAGVNCVLRSMTWQPHDALVILDVAYPMTRNLVMWLQRRYNLCVLVVKVPLPPREDTLLAALAACLNEHRGKRVRLAVFDQIVSTPALVLPVTKMSQMAKSHGVERVLIDGAHTLGHIPLDFKQFRAAQIDYFVGNFHKWFFAPKGSALFWMSEAASENVRKELAPTVISSEFGAGAYQGW